MSKNRNTLTWKDIQTQYPNKWVFVQNLKRNKDGDIILFKLLTICNKHDKAKWIQKYTADDIEFQCIRTTFSAPNIGAIL